MIAKLLANPWLILAAVVGLAAVAAALCIGAYNRGVADTQSDAREAVFNQLKERNVTDAQIEDMSDAAICRAIGGELHDGRCE